MTHIEEQIARVKIVADKIRTQLPASAEEMLDPAVDTMTEMLAVVRAADKLYQFGVKRGSQMHLELEEALAKLEKS